MALGEQIAVLDGLAALDPNDGRIGQVRARVDQYGRPVMPNVLRRMNVIAPAEGANYGGGSSYYPGGPLLPSTIGLADVPSMLPPAMNVISPSHGVNYGGGSSYAPGLPILPSTVGLVGLASRLIEGGYGRAGLGASAINNGYGRAGLGSTGTAVDEDLAAAAEAVEVARKLDPNDGRIGQFAPQVDEYGKRVMPGVLARSNVLDPSEGANYGGGSSYFPGGPLTPSNSGLAGFAACGCPPGLGDARLIAGGYGRAGLGALTAVQRNVLMSKLAYHNQQAGLERRRMAIAAQGKSVASRNAYAAAQQRLAVHIAAMKTIAARLNGKPAPSGAVRVLKKAAAKRQPVVTTPPGTEMWR